MNFTKIKSTVIRIFRRTEANNQLRISNYELMKNVLTFVIENIMQSEIKCLKCSGAIIEGFVLDRTYGGKFQQTWVEGQPETSFWTGIKISERETLNVQAFRCVDCNYLEFYTTDEVNVR